MTTNNIDNINGQGQKKPDIGDTEEPTNIGINIDNAKTKATKGKRKKIASLVLAITPLIILAGMIYFLSSPIWSKLDKHGCPPTRSNYRKSGIS